MTRVQRHYVFVALVWVATLIGLYVFQGTFGLP